MNVYDELLTIKRFREGQAEQAVAKQRQLLAEAERAREQAREELERFCAWARQRELDLYGDLCRRIVRVREIEDVMRDVSDMRTGERTRETQADEAAAQARREAEALEQRRQSYREATRMVEKFLELVRIDLEDVLKEVEHKEDLEMEEAASAARDRVDWDVREEAEAS